MSAISGVPRQRLKFSLCILGLLAAVTILLAMKPIETGHSQLPALVQLNK